MAPVPLSDLSVFQRFQDDGWALNDAKTALSRSFRFDDFKQAFAFVTRVAELAEDIDHHPDIAISYNRVRLTLTSHDAKGLTRRDLRFLEKFEMLAG